MKKTKLSPYLRSLRNRIDICKVPFSDRGSRLLIFKSQNQDRLYIKLAERLTTIQPDLEAYLLRPPFIRELYLIDENGNPLEFEAEIFPHALFFQTQIGKFGLVFQDERTLSFGIPRDVVAGLRFHVSPQFWEKTDQGGTFKSVRNLHYDTNDEVILNKIVPKGGGYLVDFIVRARSDCAVSLTVGDRARFDHVVPDFSSLLSHAADRWNKWFARVPEVEKRFRRTYTYAWWIMANNLISPMGRVAFEAMTPSKINYVGLWLWDSAMHTLAYRHIDPDLARNQIRAMLNCQLPDGMIPDAVYDDGVVSEIDHPFRAEVTKPPILAWAVLKLHEVDPDLDFLEEVYVPLVRWNAWWFSMNDDDVDGLAQYNHPYSSGLDDNPLWDYGFPVESPDLNTYLCVQMGSLAVIADALGMDAEAGMWRRRAAAIVRRMIEDFWDEEAGLFWALHEEMPIKVVTPFNLFPLWTGQLPDHITQRLLDHLTDSESFWGEYPIPSVARNDPHYDPETMWRGPTWVNINYFFVEALRQVGENQIAEELVSKTLHLIEQHPSIYEYYNSETGKPAAKAADIFGWTAAVYIDLAIQMSRAKELKDSAKNP